MKKNTFEKIGLLLIILFITLIHIGGYLASNQTIEFLNYTYLLMIMGTISLIYVIISLLKKYTSLNVSHVIILLLVIFGYISYKYAIDPNVALFGTEFRYEGLLVIISYYMLFLISSTIENDNYKKIILNTIISFGLINVIFGLLQIKDMVSIGFIRLPMIYEYSFSIHAHVFMFVYWWLFHKKL